MDGYQQKNDDQDELSSIVKVNKNLPLVSIIIPIYNAEKYVEDALNSALNQTYPNIEVIVVNDGSTDETPTILRNYANRPGLTILTHDNGLNRGVSLSRKLAIEQARGKYIAFLDADDMFLPEKIAIQVEAFEHNPDVIFCHTDVKLLCETEKCPPIMYSYFNISPKEYKYVYSSEPYFMIEDHICNPTSMVRADILAKIPYYSEQLFQLEDWLMGVLISEFGKFLYLPDRLIYYRYHPTSFTAMSNAKPLNWLYSKIEFYLCLLSRLPDEKKRSIAVIELQKTLTNLLKKYREIGLDDNNLSSVPISRIYQELFMDGLDVNGVTSKERFQSIISTFTEVEIANNFSVMEISKALLLKLTRKINRSYFKELR